jgi:hypothetical protein
MAWPKGKPRDKRAFAPQAPASVAERPNKLTETKLSFDPIAEDELDQLLYPIETEESCVEPRHEPDTTSKVSEVTTVYAPGAGILAQLNAAAQAFAAKHDYRRAHSVEVAALRLGELRLTLPEAVAALPAALKEKLRDFESQI